MAILYTLGNPNTETVTTVAKSVNEVEPQLKINTVVTFSTTESEEHQAEQRDIYEKYFGNIILTDVKINDDGTIDPSSLFSVFNNQETKIVDLSNGQKSPTAILYMAANLCQVDRIYYIMLKPGADKDRMALGQDYDYVKMRKINCAEQLAKISCFDLIYYNDEISRLFTVEERTSNEIMRTAYDGLLSGINGYFSGREDYRSVISDVTIINERIIGAIWSYITHNEEGKNFCKDNGMNINKFSIDQLRNFALTYQKKGTDKTMYKLSTVISLTLLLKEYRDISAHYVNSKIKLTEDYARIAIILTIEVIKNIKEISDLWEILKTQKEQ